MKIAVTGASGFIGSNLCDFLHRREHEVVALVRSPGKATMFQAMGVETRHCDVTEPASLETAFAGVDVVIHLAALFNNPESSWDEYYGTNVEGTKNTLEVALRCGVRRVIHCSTVGVAVGVGDPPYSEQTPYAPPSWDKYETTKCEAEKLALDFWRTQGLPVVVIRPAQVYGPGDRGKAKFYRLVKKGIIVNPDNTLKHLIFIDDLCRAFETAAHSEQAVGNVFIIGGQQIVSLKELIHLVAQELGVPEPRIKLPAAPIIWLCITTETVSQFLKIKPPLFRRSMDFFTKSVQFDVTKAAEQLDFRSEVDVPTGVAKTAAWYKENDLL